MIFVKKIYFLQNFDIFMSKNDENTLFEESLKGKDIKIHKLDINNFVILINDKLYESKNYFIPQKEGLYIITIFINVLMEDCFGLFLDCRNILNIDLSFYDTKNVTNMSHMFDFCRNLKNIDLSFLILKMLLI